MDLLRPIRLARLLLATCVSLWLAGAGCLFGCSYGSGAVVQARASLNSVVAGASCHSMHAHDCCAKKQPSKLDKGAPQLQKLSVNAVPSGMMSDCPLAVNQSAAVSPVKSDATAVLPLHSPVPGFDFANISPRAASAPLSIPNRGPTHLLHCVFLI
jgi:hypothetical protein